MEVVINIVFVVFMYYGEIFVFGIFLDGGVNGVQVDVWFYYFDVQIQVFLCDVVQMFVQNGWFVDDKYF